MSVGRERGYGNEILWWNGLGIGIGRRQSHRRQAIAWIVAMARICPSPYVAGKGAGHKGI